jgi:hypothetical protein
MRSAFKQILVLALLTAMLAVQSGGAQSREPEVSPALASGTLNLVLANKNGFVIAADSRMSSEVRFRCDSKLQLYCDNSQKLFRTGQKSAMVIAGFAAGHYNTPLDLSIAALLRKRFGATGLPDEEGTPGMASEWAEGALEQALTGVAALYDPAKTNPQQLSFFATFAGFDDKGALNLRQLIFRPTWMPTGPLNIIAPAYKVDSGAVTVTKFQPVAVGISSVADAILGGFYRSQDAVIQLYYQKLRSKQLDDLSIDEMQALARAILRETRKFTPLVGGEDQIGVFPVNAHVRWQLPTRLPRETQLSPNFTLWKGILCTNSQPQCVINGQGHVTFFQDFQHPIDETLSEFFLASQFQEIPVALDNNYFVRNRFDGVTLKWRGGAFFTSGNSFGQCVIELPEGKELPSGSELTGKCALVRKSEIIVEPTMIGSPKKMRTFGCIKQNPNGGVTATAGGNCGNQAGVMGPSLQP